MDEQIISFETAQLAGKKLEGWDQYAPYWWYDETGKFNKGNFYPFVYYTANTQAYLQKWFRDKHQIDVSPIAIFPDDLGGQTLVWLSFYSELKPNVRGIYLERHASYEAALEYGLQNALKLL